MEDIFTDSQVSGHSMIIFRIRLIFTLLILFGTFQLSSQQVSKRAIRLTEKAQEARKERNFLKAKELLIKAIEVDAQYNLPHIELAGIFNLYQQKDSAAYYFNQYVRITPESQVSQSLWDKVARLNFERGKYQEAAFAIRHVNDPDSLLQNSIQFALESTKKFSEMRLEKLPPEINAFQLQYFPVLTVDENTIIYTKRNSTHPSSDEDLVISKKINGNWIPAQSLSKSVNSEFNEGACTITADGRTLIFTSCEGRPSFGSCDLYITFREGNTWSKPENLGSVVNSNYWESQPALSADGRTLFFSSNRPGGVGKRDIWKTTLKEKGWTEPVNLGNLINTEGDETTPYIHVNNEVLFFSSDGHVGLGGFDLFISESNAGVWSSPVNLGYPINTFQDELSLFINASGSSGYFAKEVQHSGVVISSELVKFQIPGDSLIANKSSFVTGRVIDDLNNEFMGAQIKMTDLTDSTNTYHINSDSISGKYYLVLTSGNDYGVFVDKEGYLFEDFRFTAAATSAIKPDTIDIYLRPIKAGETIQMENIYFDLDDSSLRNESKTELNDIIKYLHKNPKLNFVIEGHTDNTGNAEYNMELSEQRAENVYRYLLEKGISRERMSFRGFGSTEPVATNDSSEGREKNRRITFRVISND